MKYVLMMHYLLTITISIVVISLLVVAIVRKQLKSQNKDLTDLLSQSNEISFIDIPTYINKKFYGTTISDVQQKEIANHYSSYFHEAYSLVDDRSGSFGDEAINTIVQEMENHREDVVVIFAGYPNEMEKFLQKNPGLRSRIAFHVPFADYNADELVRIAQMMGKSKGVCFAEDALAKLTSAFEAARKQSDFGNGRYVRNLLEQAKMNQASRLLEYDFDAITAEEIKTIKAEDIVIPEVKTEVKRTIGFAC